MPASEPESAQPQPEATSDIPSKVLDVPTDSLPKLIVCFDITTLSHQELSALAADLQIPGYADMTKAQLCEALLAL